MNFADAVFAADAEDLVYLKVKSAVASSFDDTEGWAPPEDAMAPADGDLGTRWSPKYLDNEWIYFDFGKKKTISTIAILWERAFATEYEILISDNAKKWKQVALMKEQNGNVDIIEFEPVKTRYVKMVGLKRVNPLWGFSIWEFLMFGQKGLNQTDKTLKQTYSDFPVTTAEILAGDFSVTPEKEDPLPGLGRIGEKEFQTGINFPSWHETEIATKKSDESIKHLFDNVNAKFISIPITWFQDDIDSTEIARDTITGSTPMDEAVGHAINYAHKTGLKVMLKPHVDLYTEAPRYYIIPSVDWFITYTGFIIHYARLAEEYNVELFCIGTELGETTTEEWEDIWRTIIFEIRKVYKGQLIYAANWDRYQDVPFWDELDFIGIDAYFPLTENENATIEELDKAWEYYTSEIEDFLKSNDYEQPVIFTELGYANVDGCNVEPWLTCSHREDQDEQADCLDSALAVLTEKPWFKGIYWWDYLPTQRTEKYGFHLGGKIVEGILSEWYEDLNE